MFNPFRKNENGPVTPKQVFEFTPDELKNFEDTGEGIFMFQGAEPKIDYVFEVFDGKRSLGKAKVVEIVMPREGSGTASSHSARCQKIEN